VGGDEAVGRGDDPPHGIHGCRYLDVRRDGSPEQLPCQVASKIHLISQPNLHEHRLEAWVVPDEIVQWVDLHAEDAA